MVKDFTEQFINGKWVTGRGGEFERIDPYTRKPWAKYSIATPEDVNDAVAAARAAFPAWRRTPAYERAQILFRLADLIEENADMLAEYDAHDNGKIFREHRNQTVFAARNTRFIAGAADKFLGETKPMDSWDLIDFTVREPLGVVAGISTWNSPLQNAANKVAPAVAAGNTIVLKPSDRTTASALVLARLCEEAGFPAGVVNVISGPGDSGRALTSHPDINKIAFTGGPPAARGIMRHATERMLSGIYELGGKSASILFPDADMAKAIPGIVAGVFAAAGQTCVAGSRLLVHESIHDEAVAKIAELAGKTVFGDPFAPDTQVGPVADEKHFNNVIAAIEAAKAEGATLYAGGGHPEGFENTLFIEPTIFTGVKPNMKIAQEEVFGPVLAVIPFSTEEEALEIANGTDFGLAASVWTTDFARAHRMGRELIAGTVWINTSRTISATAPFGGFKLSGHGRERGTEVFAEYTATKNMMLDISTGGRDPFLMGAGK
jgi:(Z)-2-((N-methylformamido)methylene)-5-hydroxybutyrolactone dehydrogenase